jgi:hypothetical protein
MNARPRQPAVMGIPEGQGVRSDLVEPAGAVL